jgi:hypothetical protein
MTFSALTQALGRVVNSTFAQEVFASCEQACTQMYGTALPTTSAYCQDEAARADLASKADACARFALVTASGSCAAVAVTEGFRVLNSSTLRETAGHIGKFAGWAGTSVALGCLAQTGTIFEGSVTDYGRDCHL